MPEVTSVVTDRSSRTDPLKVIYAGTMLASFRYSTAMPVGKFLENKQTLQLKLLDNYYFKFLLKKTTQQTVSVICERHLKDETLEAALAVEGDSLAGDEGCFLRLYISVIDIEERPKCTVLRSADTSTSVEFIEASFLNHKRSSNRLYTLKCVVRRIETTVLSNKFATEHELLWKKCMEKACTSERQERDIAYLLQRRKPIEFLTGRRTRFNSSPHIISRVCRYSKELAQYFKCIENSEPIPPTINLGLILGYLYNGKKTAISGRECRALYMISLFKGLMFMKELCTQFIVENLNDDLVVDAFEIADMTEDARLFDAVYSYCVKRNQNLGNKVKWKRLVIEKDLVACSVIYGCIVRRLGDNHGFPPAMEDETGDP